MSFYLNLFKSLALILSLLQTLTFEVLSDVCVTSVGLLAVRSTFEALVWVDTLAADVAGGFSDGGLGESIFGLDGTFGRELTGGVTAPFSMGGFLRREDLGGTFGLGSSIWGVVPVEDSADGRTTTLLPVKRRRSTSSTSRAPV